MTCPHCLNSTGRFHWTESKPMEVNGDEKICKIIKYANCPSCNKLVIRVDTTEIVYYVKQDNSGTPGSVIKSEIVYPKAPKILKSAEIPEAYYNEYLDAYKTLPVSPKASAALNRRLLQSILENIYGITHYHLSKQIEAFCKREDIPHLLSVSVNAIRAIGNFASHPLKDTNTGEVVEVEEGEAEWLLEIMSDLLDFTFIRLKQLEKRRAELNQKLEQFGKDSID